MIDTATLKTKVLDLACHGKLTKQFDEDGSTCDLLDDINIARKKLEEAGIYKNKKKVTIKKISDDDKPDLIPLNWKWVRLGTVCDIYGRIGFRGYTKADIVEEGKGAISMSPSNVTVSGKIVFDNNTYITWEKYNESPEIMLEPGDIVIVKTGSSYGKSGLIEELPEKATINPQLAILKNILCNRQYLNWCLKCSDSWKQYNDFVIGAATPTFSQEKLANLLIPMPPMAEQDRIVEILNEINATVDSVEELQQLYLSDLKALRSKIINAGIQGKLTENLSTDGGAEALLEEIRIEKAKLIKEKKIKKEKALPEISDDEIPFEIPKSWKWVRLADISNKIWAGGDKPSDFVKEATDEKNIPVVANGVTDDGILGYTSVSKAPADTITVAGRGTIGFCVYRNYEYCPIVRLIVVEPSRGVIPEYLQLVMKVLREDSVGSSIPQLTVPMIKPKVIPLPPTNEQKRIVKKVNEILTYIH